MMTPGSAEPAQLLKPQATNSGDVVLLPEIPRWEGLTHEEILARVNKGPAGQGSTAAEQMWDTIRSSITEIDNALARGMNTVCGFWSGAAADKMVSAMVPVSSWLLDSTTETSTLATALRTQAEQAGKLRNTMPAQPYTQPNLALTSPYSSWSAVDEARAEARAAAVDLMNRYTADTAANERKFAEQAPPPPATTGNGGSGGAGAGGVGAPPSAGAGGLGAVPSPDAAGAGVPGGGAGDDGAGGGIGSVPPVPAATSAANFSPPGPTSVPVHVPAVPSVAAVPSVPQSPHLLPGPIFAGSVVPPAPTTRRSGTVWSPEGAPVPPGMGTGGRRGAGGAAGGEPPRGGRGATAEPWGAARERIPGGSARGPGGGGPDMMPPTTGGAGAGSGGDRTRRRPSYLVEDADVFADDRWFPPRVIGAQQQGDDRG